MLTKLFLLLMKLLLLLLKVANSLIMIMDPATATIRPKVIDLRLILKISWQLEVTVEKDFGYGTRTLRGHLQLQKKKKRFLERENKKFSIERPCRNSSSRRSSS